MQALARPLKWPPLFPIDRKLIAWYPTDERSGSKLHDRSGNRFHGDITNGTWVALGTGAAVKLSGSGSIVDVGDLIDSKLSGISALSLAITVYKVAAAVNAGIIGFGDTVSRQIWFYEGPTEKIEIHITNSLGADQSCIVANEFPASTLIRFGASFGNSTINLYKNGALLVSNPASGVVCSGSNNNFLGYINGFGRFNGIVKNIKIWNRLLTANEFKRDYESERQLIRP